ncbi:MAG: AraC family transcriptional regulator [Microscillaceae bacterium]|nr:AraC family transcriptional regulator [Microscillaceae bacterium]
MGIYREITPLTQNDCFTIFSRQKSTFDFPLHFHEEFELNFIENAADASRIIGDHHGVLDAWELVLVGSNLPHGWFTHECKCENVFEITIQFHKDLLDERFLRRNQLNHIRVMLEWSSRGILFSKETAKAVKPRLVALSSSSGFNSVLDLFSILHDLSLSGSMQMLSNPTFMEKKYDTYSRRIEKAFNFMNQHYQKEISLADISKVVGMTEVSCSRFIKKRTGRTFTENLNEVRLGHASRMLIDTTMSVSEIAFVCGFNNISYFNRIFKKKNNCTPKVFRKNYSGTKLFV